MSDFIALGKNVFVVDKTQHEKIGAFYVPDSLDFDFIIGEVVSCSDGYYENGMFIPNLVKVGDVVCFPKISGSKISLDGKNLIKVNLADIIAKKGE